MTYNECVTIQASLEAALLSGSSVAAVSIGNRSVTYHSTSQIRSALAEINRALQSYERRLNSQNPDVKKPIWR